MNIFSIHNVEQSIVKVIFAKKHFYTNEILPLPPNCLGAQPVSATTHLQGHMPSIIGAKKYVYLNTYLSGMKPWCSLRILTIIISHYSWRHQTMVLKGVMAYIETYVLKENKHFPMTQ